MCIFAVTLRTIPSPVAYWWFDGIHAHKAQSPGRIRRDRPHGLRHPGSTADVAVAAGSQPFAVPAAGHVRRPAVRPRQRQFDHDATRPVPRGPGTQAPRHGAVPAAAGDIRPGDVGQGTADRLQRVRDGHARHAGTGAAACRGARDADLGGDRRPGVRWKGEGRHARHGSVVLGAGGDIPAVGAAARRPLRWRGRCPPRAGRAVPTGQAGHGEAVHALPASPHAAAWSRRRSRFRRRIERRPVALGRLRRPFLHDQFPRADRVAGDHRRTVDAGENGKPDVLRPRDVRVAVRGLADFLRAALERADRQRPGQRLGAAGLSRDCRALPGSASVARRRAR